jgi:aminoglycoside/choline kinase family phosphotransferase/dTDP-glucose pyrophosphorylase
MKALILAAGFGTRLAPHTRTIPKPLFPIDGMPVLGRMILNLKRAGCTGVAVNVHHLSHRIESYLATCDFGVPIHLSREPEILGTGGAIRHLGGYWDDEPFMVVNADIVTDIDMAAVYEGHRSGDAPVTMVMHDREPFNQVWVDDRDRIAGFDRFCDPPPAGRHRKMAFTGIQVMDNRTLARIPGEGFSDIISVYRQMLEEAIPVRAHVVSDHYWQDMGSPAGYRDAVVHAMAPGVFQSVFPEDRPAGFRCRRLAGDGSDRKWFRLTAGGHGLILADHGITPTVPGSEFNAFVNIGQHLCSHGLPVPRIHAHDGFSGLVFLEDLGDGHLQQALRRASGPFQVEALYRKVIDTLLDLTEKAADRFDPAWTCQSEAYDRKLIEDMECRYFVDAFLNGYMNMQVAYDDLAAEFSHLARCTVDHGIPGLIHRDFQSRNIMISDGRPFLIDFQGARTGPIQYDLASLLIDPYAGLDQDLRQRLLDYAVEQAARRLKSDPDQFIRGYRYCRVTRNLQMLGAFGFLTRVKQKPSFERWIPAAAGMLADHIHLADPQAFPRLTRIAKTIGIGYETSRLTRPMQPSINQEGGN